jgi:hypothetical protein
MKLSEGGAIDGTPSRSGGYGFTVTAILQPVDYEGEEGRPA